MKGLLQCERPRRDWFSLLLVPIGCWGPTVLFLSFETALNVEIQTRSFPFPPFASVFHKCARAIGNRIRDVSYALYSRFVDDLLRIA